MCSHDPVANTQPQPRPFAHLLGRIKGVKYAMGIRNAGSVVADRHFDHLRLPPGVNPDAPALSRFLHRIVRIIEDIQKNLLQLL